MFSKYPQEEEQNKTYLIYGATVSNALDIETILALRILDKVLIDAPGAPLKQALLDTGIGEDIWSSFDYERLQPNYSIVAKNTNPDKMNFLSVFKRHYKTLQKMD